MHGVIFDSLRAFVAAEYGPLAAVSVFGDRTFSPEETYDDDALSHLAGRVAGATRLEVDEVYRRFGRFASLTTFRAMFPDYYAAHDGAAAFLLGVEGEIHRVVRRTVPGARPPYLRVVPLGGFGVVITYTSPRHLCRLLEGLVLGVAEHYGQEVELDEVQCLRRGDLACVYNAQFG